MGRKPKTAAERLREMIEEKTPALIEQLYALAQDEEASASSRLTAIRELLDRTIGKGTVLVPTESEQQAPCEIVFRVETP